MPSGLEDQNHPVPNSSAALAVYFDPKFKSESAAGILQSLGLEKDNMELLPFYPDDQMNSDTLPFVLQQIRMQEKKASQSDHHQPFPEASPGRRTVWSRQGVRLSSSEGSTLSFALQKAKEQKSNRMTRPERQKRFSAAFPIPSIPNINAQQRRPPPVTVEVCQRLAMPEVTQESAADTQLFSV